MANTPQDQDLASEQASQSPISAITEETEVSDEIIDESEYDVLGGGDTQETNDFDIEVETDLPLEPPSPPDFDDPYRLPDEEIEDEVGDGDNTSDEYDPDDDYRYSYDDAYVDYGEEEDPVNESAEAYEEQKRQLINSYIRLKTTCDYESRKNAYLQDKVYQISVRKGIIVEEGQKEERRISKLQQRLSKVREAEAEEETLIDIEEAAEESEEEEERDDPPTRDDEVNVEDSQVIVKTRNVSALKSFREAALENKYANLINKLQQAASVQQEIQELTEHRVNKLQEKSKQAEDIHDHKLQELMSQLKSASSSALDSHDGRHLNKAETEAYLEEILKIHTKLVQSLTDKYRNRYGLQFSLLRLHDTEFQGEGLQMLEYEQLQAENHTLEQKLTDRIRDVELVKGKIAHAVQVLAHFRECMFRLNEKFAEGHLRLQENNQQAYHLKALNETFMRDIDRAMKEERTLFDDAGLLNNPRYLADYEKTQIQNQQLERQRRQVDYQLRREKFELQDISTKLDEIGNKSSNWNDRSPRTAARARSLKLPSLRASTARMLSSQYPCCPQPSTSPRLDRLLAERILDPPSAQLLRSQPCCRSSGFGKRRNFVSAEE